MVASVKAPAEVPVMTLTALVKFPVPRFKVTASVVPTSIVLTPAVESLVAWMLTNAVFALVPPGSEIALMPTRAPDATVPSEFVEVREVVRTPAVEPSVTNEELAAPVDVTAPLVLPLMPPEPAARFSTLASVSVPKVSTSAPTTAAAERKVWFPVSVRIR